MHIIVKVRLKSLQEYIISLGQHSADCAGSWNTNDMFQQYHQVEPGRQQHCWCASGSKNVHRSLLLRFDHIQG